ncbi:MAG: O-antigen ligase family protein [Clostridia bacterium]|nr:O-antigen ligase family protein [Clostridia bacterium]
METKAKMRLSPSSVARLGIIMIFAVYPLLMINKYYNISDTKYSFFCLVSAACLALCLILLTLKTDFSDPASVVTRIRKQITVPDIAMLVFALVSVISCIGSDYFYAALSGGQGRQMGLVMYLSLSIAFFFISKFYILRNKDFYFLGIAFIIVVVFAVVQFVGYDPFGLIATLTSVRKSTFLSTIGNMNVYASYICVVAPLAMYFFCFESDKKKTLFWHIISCVGFFGLFTANSDSGYIGMALAIVIIFILSAKSESTFRRMWILILSFFIAAGIFKFLSVIYANTIHNITLLTRIATSKYAVMGGVVVSSTVIYVMKLYKPDAKFLKTVQKISVAAVIIAVLGVASLFIYFSFINTEISIGGLEGYLRFNENWGTGRGDLWTKAFKAFSQLPLNKKLFGAGEDTYALLLTDMLGYSEIRIGRSYYDNAHNEFIQHLLSVGIIGLASYLLLAIYAVKTAIKSDCLTKKAVLISILAFLCQSFINILQPITSPFIFVLIALTQCKTETE